MKRESKISFKISALNKSISIWGLPGAGKSYWGKKLSDSIKIHFIDLDLEIEKSVGKKIVTIFKDQGEEEFRLIEKWHLEEIIRTQTSLFVLSTGGGTPCFHNNFQLLKNNTLSFYLDVNNLDLVRNLERSNESRPIFENIKDLQTKLDQLRLERDLTYRKADHIINPPVSLNSFLEVLEVYQK